MDQTTYPGSETDINEVYDHCDFQSTTSNDFVDRWVNLTVEKEILRGTQLREEKLKSYPELLECEVVNINVDNPICYDEDPYLFRKCSPGRSRGKTIPCSPRPNSPFVKQTHHSRCPPQPFSTGSNSPNKYAARCPLRIAELAVPTKRQCMDTWRNKCNVLPAFMVERLRQQIMDEKPVVQISDAVSCFARRRPKSIKSVNKRSKKLNRETKQKIDKDAEIRKLCAAFANKIARKLITPQNLNLNPELDKLSKVVANEITNIIKKRKKYGLDNITQKRIHADIASKIAVWIATILEDSSYKLLEDDLRVKYAGKEIKEDPVLTLLENFCQERASELEEEEGPVLDFIDDLVKNVVTICEPDITINMDVNDVSETTSKADSDKHDNESLNSRDSMENNEFDTSTLYTNVTSYDSGEGTIAKSSEAAPLGSKTQISVIQEIENQSFDQNDDSEGIELTINNHIQEEIDKILDSITESNTTNEVKDSLDTSELAKDNLKKEIDLPSEFQNIQESPGNSELTTHINETLSTPSLRQQNVNEDAVSNVLNDGDDKSIKIVGSEVDNVNEAFDLSEESPDEKNKKVKFSEIDMALRGGIGKLVDSTKIKDEIDQILLSASTHSIRPDLVLAPPNENLLSDADESWPEDIRTTALKPSASVNRSITSLGKILEKDEKYFLTEDNILSELNLDDSHKRELSNKYYNDEQDESTKEIGELKEKLSKAIGKLEDSKTKSSPDSSTKAVKSTAVKGTIKHNKNQETINIPVTQYNVTLLDLEDKGLLEESKPEIKRLIGDDIKNLESDTNFIYEAVQQKMKTSYALPEQKFDYKVHPKTAPSWLRNDNGKGEPSEDSFREGYKTKAPKFKDSYIRSWCKDLDRIFINLEMWNGWMETTCKNVLYFKQKREMNKLYSPCSKKKIAREWVKLKKNIDKDAVLWNKLNQRAIERLKSYKEKAKHHLAEKMKTLQLNSNRSNNELITTLMEEIDCSCLWIHRTIVSTEYCMACDCKNNPRRC